MSYSASDFAEEVFGELVIVGAIPEALAEDEDLGDNSALQTRLALEGIARLVGAKDALIDYRASIQRLAKQHGIDLTVDPEFCLSDRRCEEILSSIKVPEEAKHNTPSPLSVKFVEAQITADVRVEGKRGLRAVRALTSLKVGSPTSFEEQASVAVANLCARMAIFESLICTPVTRPVIEVRSEVGEFIQLQQWLDDKRVGQ